MLSKATILTASFGAAAAVERAPLAINPRIRNAATAIRQAMRRLRLFILSPWGRMSTLTSAERPQLAQLAMTERTPFSHVGEGHGRAGLGAHVRRADC